MLRIFLKAVIPLLLIHPSLSHAQELNGDWIGTAGNYSDATKWNAPAIPCNTGPISWLVTIPDSNDDVTVDGGLASNPCKVKTLTTGTDSILRLAPGMSYEVLINAAINGWIVGEGGDFTASSGANMDISVPPNGTVSLGNRARFRARGGSEVRIGVGTYSPTGLTKNDGSIGSGTTTWNVLEASGVGSLLSLPFTTTIDDGFPRNSNDKNRHEAIIADGGELRLPLVTQIIAPVYREDWIRFNVTDATSTLNLDSLTDLSSAGSGETRFSLTGNADVSIPVIQNMDRVVPVVSLNSTLHLGDPLGIGAGFGSITDSRFFANSGGMILDDDTAMTMDTTGLTRSDGSIGKGTFTWDILNAVGASSLIDFSSLILIDAGFSQNSNDVNRHEVTVNTGAEIDLSGLEAVNAPVSREDWIRFNVSGATSILTLDSLAELTSAGSGETRFVLTNSANVSIPSIETIDRGFPVVSSNSTLQLGAPPGVAFGFGSITDSRFYVDSGGTILDDETAMTMTTTGLTRNDGSIGSSTFTWNILNAVGTNSLIDFSSLISIDAGFSRNSNDLNRHEINCNSGAQLNLAGLGSTLAPVDVLDWIGFNIDDGCVLDLLSYSTGGTASRGRTRFNTSNAASLSMPSLTSLTAATFSASSGATLSANSSPWSLDTKPLTRSDGSIGSGTFSWNILTATGGSTNVDFSAMKTFDAGFPQNSNDKNRHEVSCDSGANIDLSGVTTIITPASSSDWLRFTSSDGCAIDLSSLIDIASAGSGQALFEVSGTGHFDLTQLRALNSRIGILATEDSVVDVDEIEGQEVTTIALGDNARLTATQISLNSFSSIDLGDSTTELVITGDLDIEDGATLTGGFSSSIEIKGNYTFKNTDVSEIELDSAIVLFNGDGGSVQIVEVGGFDVFTLMPTDGNFGFGQMVVGEVGFPTTVRLVDKQNNGNRQGSCDAFEAHYLFGANSDNGLYIEGNSYLLINHINTYAWDAGAGGFVWLNGLFNGNETELVGIEHGFGPGVLARNLDDTDGDQILDPIDNCPFRANLGQEDTSCNRIGNACTCGDMNGDGFVDGADLTLYKRFFGGLTSPFSGDRCGVSPAPDGGACNGADLTIIKRFFGGLPPGITNSCSAFVGP